MVAEQSVTLIQSVVLGVVQGLTEFLPISSSAHLRVVPAVLGWSDPGAAYSAVLQLGSAVAVVSYFFKQLIGILTGTISSIKRKDYSSTEFRLGMCIIIGTIPICVIGLIVKKVLESHDSPVRSLLVIGIASIVMGLFLIVAERFGSHKRNLSDIGGRDGLLVGLGQALALIPGCSRSGSTLTVALLLGLNRADAARFSFLLGIPAVVLSGLVELKEVVGVSFGAEDVAALAAGLVASTIVSYLSIVWMIRYLQKHSTWIFVAYRLIFGACLLFFAGQLH